LRNIILFILLSTSLFAGATTYMGYAFGINNEAFSKGSDETVTSDMMKLKFGYGIRDAYAIELSVQKTNNKASNIIDASANPIQIKENTKYSVNIEFVKSWDLGIYILPLVKAGFGAGFIDISAQGKNLQGDPVPVSSLSFGSFNIGTGFYIPMGKHFDFEVIYDYRYQSYQNLDASTTSTQKGPEFESQVHIGYIGLNYRF